MRRAPRPRPDSPVEKEVVFFEEKEVAFVHPVDSSEDTKSELLVPEVEEDEEEDEEDVEDVDGDGDGEVYLLQPRTYTPQPPEPLPSPMVKSPSVLQSPMLQDVMAQDRRISKRTSLRQRVSLKGGNLPEVIHVPPRNMSEMSPPGFQSPQYQPSPLTYQGRDSEYVSGLEVRRSHHSPVETSSGMAVPKFTNTIPSPRSDQQQYFYPVRASPHSPLQQRPHTSATQRPHTAHAGQVREQRSAMGMSMLSNVATVEGQDAKKLKKKKSAFGWLKKAFTLDEEERQEFRSRKEQQALNPYYEARSPKFLDGKRLPDPRRPPMPSRSVSRM